MTASRIAPWTLLLVRVFTGAFFLYEASNQLAKGWIGGDGLERMLTSALRDHSIPGPYRRFLEDVVLQQDQLFTLLVIPGEVAVGVALVLGLATRPTAVMALFMNVNFAIMNGVVTAGGLFDVVHRAGERAAAVCVAAGVQHRWRDRAARRRGDGLEEGGPAARVNLSAAQAVALARAALTARARGV